MESIFWSERHIFPQVVHKTMAADGVHNLTSGGTGVFLSDSIIILHRARCKELYNISKYDIYSVTTLHLSYRETETEGRLASFWIIEGNNLAKLIRT